MNLKKKEGREIVAILEDQSAFFRTSNSTMLGRARRQTRGCSSISNKVNWKTLFARRGLRERAGERFPRVGDSMATREGWLLYRCLASLVEALQLNGIEKTRRGNRRGGPSELAKLIFLIGTIGSNGSTIGERERERERERETRVHRSSLDTRRGKLIRDYAKTRSPPANSQANITIRERITLFIG